MNGICVQPASSPRGPAYAEENDRCPDRPPHPNSSKTSIHLLESRIFSSSVAACEEPRPPLSPQSPKPNKKFDCLVCLALGICGQVWLVKHVLAKESGGRNPPCHPDIPCRARFVETQQFRRWHVSQWPFNSRGQCQQHGRTSQVQDLGVCWSLLGVKVDNQSQGTKARMHYVPGVQMLQTTQHVLDYIGFLIVAHSLARAALANNDHIHQNVTIVPNQKTIGTNNRHICRECGRCCNGMCNRPTGPPRKEGPTPPSAKAAT
jgi:hypothetical protein